MQWFKVAFSAQIKSGCKLPKFHSSFHYYHFIQEYGVPSLTYTGKYHIPIAYPKQLLKRQLADACSDPEYGYVDLQAGWWEKSHRFLVKMPYLRIGKNTKRLYELLLIRVVLADRVRQMIRVMKVVEGRETVDWVDREAGVGRRFRIIKRISDEVLSTMEQPAIAQETYTGYDKDGRLELSDE